MVSTLCTQNPGEAGVPGAGPVAHRTICAINGYFIYIVRIVPPGLFTPTSGRLGRSVWTGDYTNGWRAGRGGAGAAGNRAPGLGVGLGRGGRADLSRAWPLTLQGKETCLPAIAGGVGAGDSGSRAPIPRLQRPIPNSRSPRLGKHTATNKQELPGGRAI